MNSGRVKMLVAAAGLALTVPAYFGLFFRGYPTPISPLPLLTTIPALFLSVLIPWGYWFAILVPTTLFFLWSRSLFHGVAVVPLRSRILFGILAALSVAYLTSCWSDGVEYNGLNHTIRMCAINSLWLVLLLLLMLRQRKDETFGNNLVFHWILFAWMAWYAFPYLGELP